MKSLLFILLFFSFKIAMASDLAPKVLYHWLPEEYLVWKTTNSKMDNFLPFPLAEKNKESNVKWNKPMWAWRTAVGTFGYGDVSIRMEIKENTPLLEVFEEQRSCEQIASLHGKESLKTSVFISKFMVYGNYTENFKTELTEYILCSSDMINKWSFGTKEHLEEMITEIESIKKLGAQDSFLENVIPWDIHYLDGKYFNKKVLNKNLKKMKSMVKKNKGMVFQSITNLF